MTLLSFFNNLVGINFDLHCGVFFSHIKRLQNPLIKQQKICCLIFSVCSPAVLRPVGRKLPQATPTLRVTVTAFIPRHSTRFSPFAAGGAFRSAGGSPAPFALKCATPQLRARLRFRLQNNIAYYKGLNKRLRRPCNRSLFCAQPSFPPRISLRAALQSGGVLGALRLPRGVRSTPRRFYRALLRNGLRGAVVSI